MSSRASIDSGSDLDVDGHGTVMKAIRVETYGGPLQWTRVKRPDLKNLDQNAMARLGDYLQLNNPQDGVLILQVRAVGISLADNLGLHGRYQVKAPLPMTPGAEAAGYVVAVANGVTLFMPGDPAGVILPWTTGTCAEEILLHE